MIGVRVENLIKKFGDVLALNEISVSIEPGELFFLLGPSGCGKTTLLRSLAGFYIPESGNIYFGDDDVTRLEPHKRKTGMMFQSYALWPHMSVLQNVAFGLEQQNVSKTETRKRAMEALESVQMGEYAERKPNALSGGQQQRVALARALVIRPRCLLLDEPLSNLDAKLRLEMRTEIRRICKEFELTTVYVTHDQKEALSIADRMAILESGNIHQIGSPLEVYNRPKNRFVASFIGETNFIEGKIESKDGNRARVSTGHAAFDGNISADDTLNKGDTAHLSLRPECIRIKEDKPDSNYIEGNIVDAIYYGEVAHYVFKSGDTQLKISELNPRHLDIAHDRKVYAHVDAGNVVILKN